MITLSNNYFRPLIAIAIFAVLFGTAGISHGPNWDERASLDIAQGIRPPFKLDSSGRLTTSLHYENFVPDSVFSSADYERYNTPGQVFRSVMFDNSNAILYYTVLHYLMKLTGTDIAALRLLSIVMAALCLLMVYRIARLIFPDSPGWQLFAVLITAVNGLFLQQSFSIRAYMLATLLLLFAAFILIKMIVRNDFRPGNLLTFSAASTAAIFCHYFSVSIIAGCCLALAIHFVRRNSPGRRSSATSRISAPVAITALAIPVIFVTGYLILASGNGTHNLSMINEGWNIKSTGTEYDLGFTNFFRQLYISARVFTGTSTLPPAASSAWIFAGGIVIGFLAFLFLSVFSTWWQNDNYIMPVICFTAIIVYMSVSIWSGHFMIFEKKYLIFQLPFFALLFASVLKNAGTGRWRTMIYLAGGYMVVLQLTVFMITFNRLLKKKPVVQPFILGQHSAPVYLPYNLVYLQQAGDYLSSHLSTGAVIEYNNPEHAHYLNYFLRSRPDLQQKLVMDIRERQSPAANQGQLIIRSGANEWTVKIIDPD